MVKVFRVVSYGKAYFSLADDLSNELERLQGDGWYIMRVDKYEQGRDTIYLIVARKGEKETS